MLRDTTARVGISIISLAPGFSPVLDRRGQNSRFNGFSAVPEAAEAADVAGGHGVTGLKPSANESRFRINDFTDTPERQTKTPFIHETILFRF